MPCTAYLKSISNSPASLTPRTNGAAEEYLVLAGNKQFVPAQHIA